MQGPLSSTNTLFFFRWFIMCSAAVKIKLSSSKKKVMQWCWNKYAIHSFNRLINPMTRALTLTIRLVIHHYHILCF